jgi:hypothetical protein
MSGLIFNMIISFIIIWAGIEVFLNFANRVSVYESGISHKNFMISLRMLSFILFAATLLFIQVNLEIFDTKIKFICYL